MSQTTHIYAFNTALNSMHKCMLLNCDGKIRQVFLLIKISYFCFVVPLQNNAILRIPGRRPWTPSYCICPCGSASPSGTQAFFWLQSCILKMWLSYFLMPSKPVKREWIMFQFLQEAGDYFLLYYKEKCSFSYIMQFSESVDKKTGYRNRYNF